MKMNEKIKKAIEYMQKVSISQGRDWISPTEIGVNVGGSGKHSSYGSPIMKEMVSQGLAIRNEKGRYMLIVLDL